MRRRRVKVLQPLGSDVWVLRGQKLPPVLYELQRPVLLLLLHHECHLLVVLLVLLMKVGLLHVRREMVWICWGSGLC
jgi:hypothetical protein